MAVGDITKVRESATQQLIAQQVYWLDSLETKFPEWLYRKVYVNDWIKRPADPSIRRVSEWLFKNINVLSIWSRSTILIIIIKTLNSNLN